MKRHTTNEKKCSKLSPNAFEHVLNFPFGLEAKAQTMLQGVGVGHGLAIHGSELNKVAMASIPEEVLHQLGLGKALSAFRICLKA